MRDPYMWVVLQDTFLSSNFEWNHKDNQLSNGKVIIGNVL